MASEPVIITRVTHDNPEYIMLGLNPNYPGIQKFLKSMLTRDPATISRAIGEDTGLFLAALHLCTDFGLDKILRRIIVGIHEDIEKFAGLSCTIHACLEHDMFTRDNLGPDANLVDAGAEGFIRVLKLLVDHFSLTLSAPQLQKFFFKIEDADIDPGLVSEIPAFPISNDELRGMFSLFARRGNISGRTYILTRYSVSLSFLDNNDWFDTFRVPWDIHAGIMIDMYDLAGARDILSLKLAGGNVDWVAESFRTFVAFGRILNVYSVEIANDLFFNDEDGYYVFVFFNRARRTLGLPNVPDELLRGILLMLH